MTRRRSVRRPSSVPCSYLGHPVTCCKQSPAITVINFRRSHWVNNICGVTPNSIFSQISRCISETVIVRWTHAARQFVSLDYSLSIHTTFSVIALEASLGETKMWAAVRENGVFCTCGSNNCETVEDRWVHAAKQFVSMEFSFHPYNIERDCPMGVSKGNKTKMW